MQISQFLLDYLKSKKDLKNPKILNQRFGKKASPIKNPPLEKLKNICKKHNLRLPKRDFIDTMDG